MTVLKYKIRSYDGLKFIASIDTKRLKCHCFVYKMCLQADNSLSSFPNQEAILQMILSNGTIAFMLLQRHTPSILTKLPNMAT